ncbi:MAG: hypothetical protein LBL04_07650 [Bacteroidales bacterium]|jgi:hypothetical protein|nr:hypothetical protein [Bacteroidales bacterium]
MSKDTDKRVNICRLIFHLGNPFNGNCPEVVGKCPEVVGNCPEIVENRGGIMPKPYHSERMRFIVRLKPT